MLFPDPTTLRQQARWHTELLDHEAEVRHLTEGERLASGIASGELIVSPHRMLLAFRHLAVRLPRPHTMAHH